MQNETMECLALEEETKANINWFEQKTVKLRKIRKHFINPTIQNVDFC